MQAEATANQLYQTLGKYKSHHLKSNQLIVNTTCGILRLIFYTPSIVRISINQSGVYDDFSYAIVSKPENLDFVLEAKTDKITLSTTQLYIVILKNPVRLQFYNKKGYLLNEDEPAFGTTWIGEQVTNYKKIQPDERFIGLGKKTGNLNRRGNAYTNWNTDAYGYDNATDMLYTSMPFFIGLHSNLVYGIFLDNSHKSHFNFGASNDRFASFSADAGDMNYYFFTGDSVADIIREYTHLTGRMELPPLWSLGYQQCKFSYYPDTEVINIAQNFRDRQIPCDVIYLDIHYMDAYKVFTWHPQFFPKPKELIKKLKAMGFKVVVILDPGVKVEEGYRVYEEGLEKDVFLKYPDGTYYKGDVWPGWCHFPDFTNPAVRLWWAAYFNDLVDLGIEGFWNDMNEIATWGKKIPDLVLFDYEGFKASTRKANNIYGMSMAKASFEAAKKLLQKRPFSLTRSGFSGIQRYAAVWTGDNVANDESMLLGVRLVNSMGLTGIAFTGYDIGGFVGDTEVSLYARWISIGAFCPFFRSHTSITTRPPEPWDYGREVEEISRNYINLRYCLTPYLYSAFYEATQSGKPINRSLAIDYTFDTKIYESDYQNQYFFGQSLLICPCESAHLFCKVYLPEANGWYHFFTGKFYQANQEIIVEAPLQQLPVFVKAGAIIPIQSVVQSLSEKPKDILQVHIYYAEQSNTFLYYEDDGETYDYQKGTYYQREISLFPDKKQIIFSEAKGSFSTRFQNIQLILHDFKDLKKEIPVNGNKLFLKKEEIIFLPPIPQFDPFPDIKKNVAIKAGDNNYSLNFKNQSSEIIIEW